MRHFSIYAIGFMLTVLLVTTTPVGTGGTAHPLDLLHPLFSHVHIVNGRVLTHEQLANPRGGARSARVQPAYGGASTLGSASGGAPDGLGLGTTPTVPTPHLVLPIISPFAWPPPDARVPRGREEAPPVPPPLT